MMMRLAAMKANFLPFHCIIVGISILGIPASPLMEPLKEKYSLFLNYTNNFFHSKNAPFKLFLHTTFLNNEKTIMSQLNFVKNKMYKNTLLC